MSNHVPDQRDDSGVSPSPQRLTAHLLAAFVAGAILVIVEFPLSVLSLISWITAVALVLRFSARAQLVRTPILLTHITTFATVVILAYLAPFKTEEDHFGQIVTLPNTEMTLAELEEIAEKNAVDDCFVRFSFDYRQNLETYLISFPKTEVALGDFITTIEEQSPLRRHFTHCANAYTVLWGYPPSYLLRFTDAQERASAIETQ